MRVVKAAAVQISPVLYSREGTVEKVVRKIHELGQQGVQMPGWTLTSRLRFPRTPAPPTSARSPAGASLRSSRPTGA
jgi:nitrilase